MPIRDKNVAGGSLDCDSDSNDSSVDMNDVGRINININNSNDDNKGNDDEKEQWSYTNKSVREALDANRKLKVKILSELERISRRKRDNRLEAARCIERSCAVILAGKTKIATTRQSAKTTTALAATKTTTAASKKNKKRKRKRKRKKNNNNRDGNDDDDDDIIDFIDRVPTSKEVSSLFDDSSNEEGEEDKGSDNDENNKDDKDEEEKEKEKDDDYIDDKEEKRRKKTDTKNTKAYTKQSNNHKGIWPNHTRKKFRYNPYRKWDLDYFVDPTGSRPKENLDMIRRQAFMMKKNNVVVVDIDNDNDNAISTTTMTTTTTNEINPDNTVCTNNPTDTAKIQQQQQQQQERIQDTFFYHTSHPFTCQEKARLDKWLLRKSSTSSSSSNSNKNVADPGEENNNNTNIDGNGGDDDDDDDGHDKSSNSYYENIAQKLREEHHENPAARKRDQSLLPTAAPRTTEDIRMYHRHHLSSRYKFSKRESLIILEGVAGTASTATSTTVTGKLPVAIREEEDQQSIFWNIDDDDGDGEDNHDKKKALKPDWELICNRVIEEHHRVESTKNLSQKKETNDDRPYVSLITPYKCMVHYKTKLRPQPNGSFTSEEDEFILRYVAAMGPQFMWGYPQIADLASRIFPYKVSRRIYERTHWSQWHPLSKDTMWTKEEEMKLVLAMKIYSDNGENSTSSTSSTGGNDADEEQMNQKQAVALEKISLRRAAAHFHPIRQPYKVSKKWERSFSPRFSYKRFSKEEDTKLLEVVRSLAATTHFSEIARKHFPDRSTDQISQRWNKIAPDKDIVEKLVPSMVHSGVKRGLVARMTATGEDAPNGSENMDINNTVKDGAIFDPSDFVVELAPKDNEGINQD